MQRFPFSVKVNMILGATRDDFLIFEHFSGTKQTKFYQNRINTFDNHKNLQ